MILVCLGFRNPLLYNCRLRPSVFYATTRVFHVLFEPQFAVNLTTFHCILADIFLLIPHVTASSFSIATLGIQFPLQHITPVTTGRSKQTITTPSAT